MKLEHLFARQDEYSLVLDVSPEIAEDWISHCNSRNRNLSDKYVEYLIKEIEAGRWKLTHQGIAFSPNRVLLDGQHRLWAVALSGKTVPMRVFFNVPPEAMDAIDTGRVRTNDQIISLAGELGQITPAELATLRAMTLVGEAYRRRSPGEERELLQRHLDAVRFAMRCLPKSNYRGVANGTTRAVLARAWYSADRGKLRHFADVLQAGIPQDEHDQPILTLVQFLTKSTGRRSGAGRREAYQKTERALAAFLSGERMTRLYAATEELFPLPEESRKASA